MTRYQPSAGQGSGIIGAAIIGGSILAGSVLLNNSLRDASTQLEGIQTSLTDTRKELATLAANRPEAGAPNSRPDPNKIYAINTKGAPYKGALQAKVEVVEFSDFQ